jgi:glycosyltransferase involved in cell wall biosynthesis
MALPTLAAAGMEMVVSHLAIQLVKRGHDVGVTCIEEAGPLAPTLISAGVEVAVVPTLGLVTNVRAPALQARFTSRMLDVVHTHSGTWLKAAHAARRARVPGIIHTVHGLHDREPWFSRALVRAAMHYTDAITTVSAPLLDYMMERHKPYVSSVVIPNGIDLTRFVPASTDSRRDRRAYREAAGVPADGILIGHVARLMEVKNQSLLLKAFQLVSNHAPDTRLALVGDGPLRGALEAEARALGIYDKVHFAGAVEDVASWLKAFDLFVLCSDAEGTSISVLEALASGLCVVATAVGGNVELLDDGRAGLLVPPKQREALANALLRAVTDERLRGTLGRTGRARVEARYSQDAMVDAYERLYREAARTVTMGQ